MLIHSEGYQILTHMYLCWRNGRSWQRGAGGENQLRRDLNNLILDQIGLDLIDKEQYKREYKTLGTPEGNYSSAFS